jgi:hypothetical protein
MSSSIIFNQVLVNGAEVWDTRSSANKHTYFCEEDECGNETHSDNKCDSCRASLIAYASGAYEHTCSGEIDYDTGNKICDDRDDPSCPQNRAAQARERLLLEIRNTETMLSWGYEYDREVLEQSLVSLREKLATAYPEDIDWREYTGHCSKCDFFYHMHSSMDRRDLCYICQ